MAAGDSHGSVPSAPGHMVGSWYQGAQHPLQPPGQAQTWAYHSPQEKPQFNEHVCTNGGETVAEQADTERNGCIISKQTAPFLPISRCISIRPDAVRLICISFSDNCFPVLELHLGCAHGHKGATLLWHRGQNAGRHIPKETIYEILFFYPT